MPHLSSQAEKGAIPAALCKPEQVADLVKPDPMDDLKVRGIVGVPRHSHHPSHCHQPRYTSECKKWLTTRDMWDDTFEHVIECCSL